MAIVRWEPLREFTTLQNEMNRLFGSVFDAPAPGNGSTLRRWMPAMDLLETDSHFVLRADLPGMSEEDVNIEVEERVLTVSGERKAEHDRAQGRLPAHRARVRLVLALAHAARRRRPRGRLGQLRPRRARGADPQARAAQAAQDLDRRRRLAEDDRYESRPRTPRGVGARRHAARPRSARAAANLACRVLDPHARPGLLRPHRHAQARPRRGAHARVRPAGDQGGRQDARGPRGRRRSATTWCSGTRSTCSSRPGTS